MPCSSHEHLGTGNIFPCKEAYLHQWSNCKKKKNCQGIQAAGHSSGDGSAARSVHDNEMFALAPFPELKEWGYVLSQLRVVATRVRLRGQAEAEAFMCRQTSV